MSVTQENEYVLCVEKKMRKYKKKFEKITATEERKNSGLELNEDQRALVASKDVILEMIQELESLKQQLAAVPLPMPQEKMVYKEVVQDPAISAEGLMRFNYLHGNGILLDPQFDSWLEEVLSEEAIESLRKFCFRLVCPGDSIVKCEEFNGHMTKLVQKSNEKINVEGVDATYQEVEEWVKQIFEVVESKERTQVLVGQPYPRPESHESVPIHIPTVTSLPVDLPEVEASIPYVRPEEVEAENPVNAWGAMREPRLPAASVRREEPIKDIDGFTHKGGEREGGKAKGGKGKGKGKGDGKGKKGKGTKGYSSQGF